MYSSFHVVYDGYGEKKLKHTHLNCSYFINDYNFYFLNAYKKKCQSDEWGSNMFVEKVSLSTIYDQLSDLLKIGNSLDSS